MAMKENFFRSMTWMHTWVGLLVCWLAYLVFFAGTVSFFRDEITLWSKPELHSISKPPAEPIRIAQQREQITNGIAYLANTAPDSSRWRISLPTTREPQLVYAYEKPRAEGSKRFGGWQTYIINPETGEATAQPRDSKGGNFFTACILTCII
eukprot:TRINITY_DN7552_c0_g1_i1.p1 TRINITY_DN7552_c0_g1~~TRINITY_DN7552_c0_g1_i1.p1  ORF type:complete len:152 (+),score=6.00 TRINITY_DN7552_c0_g1_i1:92-547(+)